ncbi:cytidylyltransferase domain-containing protein [Rossellomorea sp. LjRoot5]|uniref:cytidylyltransferase domain-containing protein n=1 Tax=Rossellomorea sp. LjRoot5 TaxID=3342331 RepID=UPI003ECD6726
MRVIAIIQARMGSSRLPGKILKKVMGKTLLEYQLERIQRSTLIDEVIIATTVKESDYPIVELCRNLDIKVYRGSEQDVLARYYEAARMHNGDVIVRLTSDCPLIDPEVIDSVIQMYLDNIGEIDYVSNTLERTFPRGLDTEVFSNKILEEAFNHAKKSIYREHVTSYFYNNPDKYKLLNNFNTDDQSDHRWTVDTIEDLVLITKILECIYPQKPFFNTADVLDLIKDHKEWKKINSHIEQKKV